MLGFILADLRRGWPGALAIGLIVALATALGIVVTLEERALRLGSARAANAFDLLIGAPGSETQLVLSSVFLQPAPLPLLSGGFRRLLSAFILQLLSPIRSLPLYTAVDNIYRLH